MLSDSTSRLRLAVLVVLALLASACNDYDMPVPTGGTKAGTKGKRERSKARQQAMQTRGGDDNAVAVPTTLPKGYGAVENSSGIPKGIGPIDEPFVPPSIPPGSLADADRVVVPTPKAQVAMPEGYVQKSEDPYPREMLLRSPQILQRLTLESQAPIGYLDKFVGGVIYGWCLYEHDKGLPARVRLCETAPCSSSLAIVLGTVSADVPRPDVSARYPGNHGFAFRPPESLQDGRPHIIFAYALTETGALSVPLRNSPISMIWHRD